MRKIGWTAEAVANLEAIADYISAFNPAAAERLARRLIELADSLADFSDRGRDAGEGRREMTIVWPYLLRYRVEGDRVIILRIRHGAAERRIAEGVRAEARRGGLIAVEQKRPRGRPRTGVQPPVRTPPELEAIRRLIERGLRGD